MQGIGLNSGQNESVILTRGLSGAGQRWFLGGREFALREAELCAQRTTVLLAGQQVLRTPEHLAAALLCWPCSDMNIQISGEEVPILDGSARPFYEELEKGLGAPSGDLHFYACPLVDRYDFGYGYFSVEASMDDSLHLDVSLDRHGYADRLSLEIRTCEDLLPVLSARTFIFEPDFKEAQARGLLLGAQKHCGLLLRQNLSHTEVLAGAPFRHPQEPALHKMLDLVGDLATMGPHLPRLKIRIHNGGHAAHHHIIKRIRSLCP
jgi:UDP-3-O-[3-hydroxymyristoyl] N-acetylglucosamine deacetylase